jgi:hypothetical protein
MDADRQDPNAPDPSALARALRWGKSQFSLDPQPDQDILSGETAGDVALGFVPGVGQAMALRDMERARRAEDPVAGGLAAASLLPWGRLGGAVKNKLIAGTQAAKAPMEAMGAGRAALERGVDPDQVWREHGTYMGGESKQPMKWEIPDQGMEIKKWHDSKIGRDFATGKQGVVEGSFSGHLEDFMHHPEFFKNYPEARKWIVDADMNPVHRGKGDYYSPVRKTDAPRIEIQASDLNDLRKILLHEVQHGVQGVERFSSGSNSQWTFDRLVNLMLKDAKKKDPLKGGEIFDKFSVDDWANLRGTAKDEYLKKAGEVEARMVEGRSMNSAEHNKQTSPMTSMRYMDFWPYSKQRFEEVKLENKP